MRKSYEHDLYVDIFFFLSLSFILYSYSCLPDNFDRVVFFKKMFTSFYDAFDWPAKFKRISECC